MLSHVIPRRVNTIKEMNLFYLLFWLAYSVYESQQLQEYNPNIFKTYNHAESSHRILQLMRTYYEEATSRITHMNPMRFMYEESPYYEMGYIMGEIIERYRKVVENAQKPVRFHFYTLFDVLKHVELVQKLYFELYHLVRMLHETPRKWSKVPEFRDIEKIASPDLLDGKEKGGKKFVALTEAQLSDLYSLHKRLMEQQRNRLKERKRLRKKFAKIRKAFLKGLITDMKGEKKPYNIQWPLDYGWEIQIDW